jgi:hypothetical protein
VLMEYTGKHDDFCFVCGGTMELFGCQTCENCYHAECMTPSPDPDDLPTFWFCPHCVDRELHIPPVPSPTTYFTPPLPGPVSPVNATKVARPIENEAPADALALSNALQGVTRNIEPSEDVRKERPEKPTTQDQSTTARLSAPDNLQTRGKIRRTKNSYSPPRKKSKYSAFSSEVDKALSVIHRELEKAAQVGRSEENFEDKIKDLEQRLRIQDGQMLLTTRELELAQRNLAAEHRHSEVLRSEHAQYKDEVMGLREAVEKKDAELRDWRAKLRSMMGNDLG